MATAYLCLLGTALDSNSEGIDTLAFNAHAGGAITGGCSSLAPPLDSQQVPCPPVRFLVFVFNGFACAFQRARGLRSISSLPAAQHRIADTHVADEAYGRRCRVLF